MSDAIIVAIITGVITLIGIVASNISSRNQVTHEFEKQNAVFQQRSQHEDEKLQSQLENLQNMTKMQIEELTREVRAHNNFAQRIPILEEKISANEHRLNLLEKNSK